MEKNETAEAVATIGMMLQAFPSAQSSITGDSPRVYLFAVEDHSLEALKRACRAIVRGDVADLKPDFPPSAPKLAQIVQHMEDAIKVERHNAEHPFVEEGTELWRKLEHVRGGTLPTFTRTMPDGRVTSGWCVSAAELEEASRTELPPPVSDSELAEINGRLRKLGFDVGNDGEEFAA